MTSTGRPLPYRGRTARRRAVAILLQAVLVLVALAAFSVLAPWIEAKPISEAESAALASLPDGCPAFVANHGGYVCVERGVASDHPWRVALLAVVVLGAVSVAIGLQFVGRKPAPPPHAREETHP